jgi:hypothetical protein
MERGDREALAHGEVLGRVTSQRLELGLRRGILGSRVDDAHEACAEAAALRSQAQQIALHAAAAVRRRDEPGTGPG